MGVANLVLLQSQRFVMLTPESASSTHAYTDLQGPETVSRSPPISVIPQSEVRLLDCPLRRRDLLPRPNPCPSPLQQPPSTWVPAAHHFRLQNGQRVKIPGMEACGVPYPQHRVTTFAPLPLPCRNQAFPSPSSSLLLLFQTSPDRPPPRRSQLVLILSLGPSRSPPIKPYISCTKRVGVREGVKRI